MNQHVPAKRIKKAVNISLDGALVEKAKSLGINLSQLLDHHLREAVRAAEHKAWREANKEAIEAYNERVDNGTILSDFERQF